MVWVYGAWLVGGAILGIWHAAGIWRTARHASATGALMGMARLLVAGLALTVAAIFGGILPAALGWCIAFFTSVIVMNASLRRDKPQGIAR